METFPLAGPFSCVCFKVSKTDGPRFFSPLLSNEFLHSPSMGMAASRAHERATKEAREGRHWEREH